MKLTTDKQNEKYLLRAMNISKTYNIGSFIKRKKQILESVSVDIGYNSIIGCVGESGSGKSTLARIITMLEMPDAGEIVYKGKPADSKNIDCRKGIQMVFQNPVNSFDPRMTIGRSMREPFSAFGMKYNDDKIREIFKRLRLPMSVLSRKPHEISGGMAQRAAIARSLSAEPELLVLDEATSSLDVTVQLELIELLRDIQKESRISYFFISHDLDLIHYVSSSVYVLYEGKIVESGKTEEVYKNPAHQYTKKLLGR